MDQTISIYISELLYRNECVIIPRFGGFVARHVPARIAEDGSLISPPAKSLLFNRNLQNNDGLLVNFIMEKESIGYEEANTKCRSFAEACEQQLFSGYRLELKELGIFFTDTEKNIQFEPQTDVNHLIEAFGLFPVNATALPSEQTEKIIELKDRKAPATERSNRQKYIRIAAIAITVPLIAIGVIASLSNTKMGHSFSAAMGLAKEKTYEAKKYSGHNYHFSKSPAADVLTDANGYAGIRFTPDNGNYIIVNVSDTVSADKTAVKKTTYHYYKKNTIANGKYKIVVGCFSLEENAIRLINTLHDRKINATLAGQNKNGLHVVSAGASNNMEEARQLLQQVRQNYPSAWLMSE
jgi:nucleoid DNA-binding protein